jgi:type III pantothenate kinase
MLLAIDIGNTNIVCGVFEGEELAVSWRLATLHDRTADELWVLVSRLFAERGIDRDRIDGVVMASVVPALTHAVSEMVTREFGLEVLNVDAGNAGLPVRYERPAEVGADRLVNGVAAWRLYGHPPRPIIVVDFGTATTFDALSADGTYQGGIICPGVEISADALFQRAARLPRVEVRKPDALIGRTTVGSIQSGIFFGYVAMVEGIVARLRTELAAAGTGACFCVATGGLAAAIAAETGVIDEVRGDLTLAGLRFVWEGNLPAGRRPA